MKHSDINELLSAYVNNEASMSQREYVEEHLLTCSDCRDELDAFRGMRTQLVSLREFAVAGSAESRVAEVVAPGKPPQVTRSRLLGPISVGAAALVAVTALIVTMIVVDRGGNGVDGIARAQEVFENLESYRISGATTITRESWDSRPPDSLFDVEFDWSFFEDGSSSGLMAGRFGTSEIVRHSGIEYWRTMSGSGAIFSIEGFSRGTSNVVPTSDGTLEFLELLPESSRQGTELIDGVLSVKYSGGVDVRKLYEGRLKRNGVSPGSEAWDQFWNSKMLEFQIESDLFAQLWIGVEDDLLRKMIITGSKPSFFESGEDIVPAGASNYTTVLNYCGFNEQKPPKAPLKPDGELEDGWRIAGTGPLSGVIEYTNEELTRPHLDSGC